MVGLAQQAKALDEQSAALLAEAEAERSRVEVIKEAGVAAEEKEREQYDAAEVAETQRRQAVRLAAPVMESAEEAEARAAALAREAAEVEFHAQVLENRANALIRESKEMTEVADLKKTEASATAGMFLFSVGAKNKWQQLQILKYRRSVCFHLI